MEVVYIINRNMGCDNYNILSARNTERIAQCFVDYSPLGWDLKLQVEIDGRPATSEELMEYAELVRGKIDELSGRVK